MSSPLIVAHRGVGGHAPENTLAAIRMAMGIGADGVEFDVQLAKDGVPVVIHDETLLRTADRRERVADLTSKQLARVDVGSWFNRRFPKRADPRFADERVPTLEQTLKLLGGFRGRLYIELKCGERDADELSAAVCDMIANSPQIPNIIVKSFYLEAIPIVSRHVPEVQTAALFKPSLARHLRHLRRRAHLIELAREFGAGGLSVHHSLVTPRFCDLAAEAEMPLAVWTVDDLAWLKRRKRLDFDALITNDPARFLASKTG